MKCDACGGRGFTELEHGLIMVECEMCKGTGEVGEALPIIDLSSMKTTEDANRVASEMLKRTCPPDKEILGEESVEDESIGRTDADDRPTGSTVASEPKQSRKRKTRKKTAKRSG